MKQLVSTHELAGNYTVVIDTTQDKVYLDVLDYDRPGITMESNMQGSLMMDFAEMLSNWIRWAADPGNPHSRAKGAPCGFQPSPACFRHRRRQVTAPNPLGDFIPKPHYRFAIATPSL